MGKFLTADEINAVLRKIRAKYEKLIRDFKKSRSLQDAFEDRYMNALRSKMDLSIFLMAEIEAVDELYERERIKQEQEDAKNKAKQAVKTENSFADQVIEEQQKRLEKFPKFSISPDASEEIERLMGAMRVLINSYWPAVDLIFRDSPYSAEKDAFKVFYDKLLSKYDYKYDVPIVRHYADALSRRPVDMKKADYEYKFIIKETAFLLNDILDQFARVIGDGRVPQAEKRLPVKEATGLTEESRFHELFDGLNYGRAMVRVRDFVREIITAFRFRDFKRDSLI